MRKPSDQRLAAPKLYVVPVNKLFCRLNGMLVISSLYDLGLGDVVFTVEYKNAISVHDRYSGPH